MKINRLVVSLAKAEYLLNYTTEPGKGGDKRRFWREVMGFSSAEALREALLAQVAVDRLQYEGQNAYGERYQAVVVLTGSSGVSWQIGPAGWYYWAKRWPGSLSRFQSALGTLL